jgi:hypothetical protein
LGAAREGKMAPDFLEAKPARALRFLIVSAVDQKAENSNSVFPMIDMTTDEPPTVKHFVLKAVPPGVAASAMLLRIETATRERLVDAVISQMNENYVFPETAKKVEATLRVRQKAGAYNEADADSFAELLTEDLQKLTNDKHLRFNFFPMVLPKEEPQRSPIS